MFMWCAVCSYNAGRRKRRERSFFIFLEKSSKCWRKYLRLTETINTALPIAESARERHYRVPAIIFRHFNDQFTNGTSAEENFSVLSTFCARFAFRNINDSIWMSTVLGIHACAVRLNICKMIRTDENDTSSKYDIMSKNINFRIFWHWCWYVY